MRLSVHELADMSGVSVRTLHYYDQIGLLHPGEIGEENGYRWYGEAEAARLQQILFYRELDFPLREIARILSAPHYDAREALSRQRELLAIKRRRLDGILALLDDNLKGERTMNFGEFGTEELDAARADYAREAQARWGETQAWKVSVKREQERTKEQRTALEEQGSAIFRRFAALRDSDPASREVQAAVADWQTYLTENYYLCTDEILAGLGQMYTGDQRFRENLDTYGEGTAALMSRAIAIFCKREKT